ncbi:MAG: undecaprenyldiphospho-muramoylpentapeptide beta-N-acetylglucosaminyltransferase [Acidimicrobiaceae bacterium]|nr:undecaprenyldiphospho-muramoylpentapeptide beta-N-acetylglucosaminyltransferase [Acidimicrobiaceae bacterium]
MSRTRSGSGIRRRIGTRPRLGARLRPGTRSRGARGGTQPPEAASPTPTWALIAGGGTAGHVLPGICIAREITGRGAPKHAVHFVGSVRGVGTRLVAEAGFALTALPGRGLRRGISPSSLAANATAAAELARASVQAILVVMRRKPAVVVGLGGYASVAVGVAAALMRVPLVITEQNAVPGLANRLLSRLAAHAATAFEDTDLPRAAWTGNPVRAEVLAADRPAGRPAARAALGVDEECPMVAVFGGSLGARTINEAVAGALDLWRDRGDLHIRHIAGRRYYEDLSGRTPAAPARAVHYDLVAYEDDMATVYAAADLVVSRAGATTVAELAAVGMPSVLVPLPGAPGDHQTANARGLEAAGGAVLVGDGELDAARLVAEVDALIEDPGRLDSMACAARSLARPGAAGAVVDLMESCARFRRPSDPEAAG